MALSKDEQFVYKQDLKARLDYQNVLDYAKEEAERQGMEKGEKQKAIEIAKNLLNKGLEVDFISETTGLTIAEIKAL